MIAGRIRNADYRTRKVENSLSSESSREEISRKHGVSPTFFFPAWLLSETLSFRSDSKQATSPRGCCWNKASIGHAQEKKEDPWIIIVKRLPV